jgi:hypothetical protein
MCVSGRGWWMRGRRGALEKHNRVSLNRFGTRLEGDNLVYVGVHQSVFYRHYRSDDQDFYGW